MLNIEIKKSSLPLLKENRFSSSKKIIIDLNIEVVIQINFSQKNVLNIIENLIIDLILSHTEKERDVYNSFSFILEKLNKEIKKLSKDSNFSNLNIFIWITQGDSLHFSILWDYAVYLIKDNKIINIADWMQGKNLEFSYISSWNIGVFDNIYISNIEFLNHITKDDIFEISKIKSNEEKNQIIDKILWEEDLEEQYNIIYINNKEVIEKEEKTQDSFLKYIIEKLLIYFNQFKDFILENEKLKNIFYKVKSKIDFKNKNIYASFFIGWLVFSIFFLYLIISSILSSNINNIVPEEYKNKLIEANNIVKWLNQQIGNKEIFYSNIKKAEELIFDVRDKKIYLNDVKKLLDDISVLKKQINWIQTASLNLENSLIQFEDKNFELNSIFEINKKLYFVGKSWIIWPYVKWAQINKYPYPDWEELLSCDFSSEWYIYILTKTYKVLQFYKQEYKYIFLEWKNTWQNSSVIKVYNSNLYLLDSIWSNQIFRHKIWIKWFSAKFPIIDNADTKNLNILDFVIDWWFYILKQNLSIDKIFTAPSYSKRSIVINSLPPDYSLENVNVLPKLFIAQNLNYLYMLLNNKIWILEPDSKNYKDVKGLKYIWQIEPQETITNAIFIPKDGSIYIWNINWVYHINFEISDWKIIIR